MNEKPTTHPSIIWCYSEMGEPKKGQWFAMADEVQEHTIDKAVLIEIINRCKMDGGPHGDCLGTYIEVNTLYKLLGLEK
jgi:hypothetical protein